MTHKNTIYYFHFKIPLFEKLFSNRSFAGTLSLKGKLYQNTAILKDAPQSRKVNSTKLILTQNTWNFANDFLRERISNTVSGKLLPSKIASRLGLGLALGLGGIFLGGNCLRIIENY